MEVVKKGVFKKSQEKRIEHLMNDEIERMLEGEASADELETMVRTRDLYAESNKKFRFKLDMNTVLIVAGSLLEILMIIHHEKTDAITTKALGRILRIR